MPTPTEPPRGQDKSGWRFLPKKVFLRFCQRVDKQGSPTLTGIVVRLAGAVGAGLLAVALIFWRHIPSVLSFLFGTQSLLRRTIAVEIWMLLMCIMIPLAVLVVGYAILRTRLRRLEKSVDFVREFYVIRPDVADLISRAEKLRKGALEGSSPKEK